MMWERAFDLRTVTSPPSFATWLVIKMIIGIRVSEEDEYDGGDLSECGMEAYPEFTKATS